MLRFGLVDREAIEAQAWYRAWRRVRQAEAFETDRLLSEPSVPRLAVAPVTAEVCGNA